MRTNILVYFFIVFNLLILPGNICAKQLSTGTVIEHPVTLEDIEQAHKSVKNTAVHTPLFEEDTLSHICGARVFLKLENLQHTGSFKVRGAFNKISSLSEEERAKGVIAASAGNHAQGVASAAKAFGIPATIVMPETVPQTKLEATKSYGAKVVLHGQVFDEALAKAYELQKQTGATFVHPFDDVMTIAGQGTIGLEIVDDLPEIDMVIIPIGGGGLASGISVAIKGLSPQTKIIGVEPENAPSMTMALQKGEATTVKVTPTLAEGTAVAKSGITTYAILSKMLDGIVTVSEEQISEAILLLLLQDKLLTEGAGALGAAALLSGKLDVRGKNVVVIVSGGNIDVQELKLLLKDK